MSGEYPRGIITLFEDFQRDNVTSLQETVSGASMAPVSGHGGLYRVTGSTGEGDYTVLAGQLAWEVDEGHPLIMEVRLRTNLVANVSIFVGFSDAVADTGPAIEDEDGTLAANADDAFGFLLEGEQDATWQAVAVDTTVLDTQEALTKGADAANSTWQTLRLEANPNDSGTVKYFIDGELVATKTSWFDSSIVYCPVVSTDGRATAVLTDIDYIFVEAPR